MPRPHPLSEDEMTSWGERAMAQSGEAGSAWAMEIWLLPFAGMFTQPSWLNAVALATGALLCLNRRTVCAALRAVDGTSDKGFSRFHRPGFATRTWGLPFLTVLCRSERANAKRRRRHQTVPEKAAWGMRLIARWLPHRRLVMVGDGAFASLELFRTLRCHALCVARCRMDARFFNPPPARKAGQKGRPRVIGTRQLTPRTRSARKATKWVRMTIPGWRTEDGTTDRPVDVATGRALWNVRGITVPVRWVLTRDPAGRAETRVFVCSDPQRSASEILTWYAMQDAHADLDGAFTREPIEIRPSP